MCTFAVFATFDYPLPVILYSALMAAETGRDQRVKYVADGVRPIHDDLAADQSVVTHYPDLERFEEYMKQEGHLPSPLWMPIWDVDELVELWRKSFQHVDYQLVCSLALSDAVLWRTSVTVLSHLARMESCIGSIEQILGALPCRCWGSMGRGVACLVLSSQRPMTRVQPMH